MEKSIELVKMIYQDTQFFPKSEMMGLTSQMRRSSVSIPSNIAEGYGRYSDKELIYFLNISLGSAAELETQLIISKELSFLAENNFDRINCLNNEIIKMLSALLKTIKNKQVNQ